MFVYCHLASEPFHITDEKFCEICERNCEIPPETILADLQLGVALSHITEANLRLNNLFQIQDGTWQANIRDEGKTTWEYGRGKTPLAALNSAMEKVKTTPGTPLNPAQIDNLLEAL